jgi:hypothetical protein
MILNILISSLKDMRYVDNEYISGEMMSKRKRKSKKLNVVQILFHERFIHINHDNNKIT